MNEELKILLTNENKVRRRLLLRRCTDLPPPQISRSSLAAGCLHIFANMEISCIPVHVQPCSFTLCLIAYYTNERDISSSTSLLRQECKEAASTEACVVEYFVGSLERLEYAASNIAFILSADENGLDDSAVQLLPPPISKNILTLKVDGERDFLARLKESLGIYMPCHAKFYSHVGAHHFLKTNRYLIVHFDRTPTKEAEAAGESCNVTFPLQLDLGSLSTPEHVSDGVKKTLYRLHGFTTRASSARYITYVNNGRAFYRCEGGYVGEFEGFLDASVSNVCSRGVVMAAYENKY